MIESVQVTNFRGDQIEMVLAQPELSGFIVTNIEGLGPVKAETKFLTRATLRGSTLTRARVGNRNILFTIAMGRLPSVEQNRHKLYRYFEPSKMVDLVFKTDQRQNLIRGVVESNEPVIFSDMEYSKVSILCDDPYFREARTDSGVYVQKFTEAVPMFEFPFSNESLNQRLLIFGDAYPKKETVITYPGEVTTGAVFTANFYGPVKDFALVDLDERRIITIHSGALKEYTGSDVLNEGDTVYISTVLGNKYVRLLPKGQKHYIDLFPVVIVENDWIDLDPGENRMAYTASSGRENVLVEVSSEIMYAGV